MALVAATAWGTLLQRLEIEKKEAEEIAIKEATALARGYADHLERTIEAIDQILLHVRYEWELTGSKLRLDHIKRRGLFPDKSVFNVSIIDRNGKVLTSTYKVPALSSVSDRSYFTAQQNTLEDTLYVGYAALNSSTGRSVVHFSRKLALDKGVFDGVVSVSVSPEYLTASYNNANLGEKALMAIVGYDRLTRASRIGNEVFDWKGLAFSKMPIFSEETGGSLFEGDWFIDQRSRYLGWDAAENLPLFAITGLDQNTVLAPYFKARSQSIQQALAYTVILCVFTLAAMGLSMRLAWRKHQVNLTQAAYRVATEAGNEGFFICRPVYDRQSMVTDFEVLDCNENGAFFYRKKRHELVGKKLAELYPPGRHDHALKRLTLAMERGFFEDDVQIFNGRGKQKWFYLKVIRSDDVLAVTMRDITESKAHVLALEKKGNEDALTKLPNRHWLNAYLPEVIARAAQQNRMLALLFIDLDGFKKVNDTLGHDAGDELLRTAGLRMKQAVRPRDHVVRIGGDEFVVIIEVMEHKLDAAQIANRILRAFSKSFNLAKGQTSVGTSIGISVYPNDGKDAESLLKHADIAMYSVKTSGKRDYRFFDPHFYEAVRRRHDKEADLRHALEHNQLLIYYQPRVQISTGKICSMEALVRWAHPSKGLIEPLDFIPLAEETGLILPLGEVVIDKVCSQLSCWIRNGQKVVPVSINVSARQFNETKLADLLAINLKRHAVSPSLVEIELTESSMSGDTDEIRESLNAIQNMGINLSVDDFGTGYSSLSQLQRLDFDVLKVDRAFTSDLEKTKEGEVFFTAIITMAHALGMRVVAEGVETQEQMLKLKSLHCDEVQGFYISKPQPPTERQSDLPFHATPLLA